MSLTALRILAPTIAVALLGPMLAGCGGVDPTSSPPSAQEPVATGPVSAVADLQYLVEEEKLAHDVYVTLGAAWDLPLFERIAASEVAHQDAVAELLQAHQIPDPRQEGVGEFTNPDLQSLYDVLTARGLTSEEEAIQVGIIIEQTDIADLQSRIATAPADVVGVLESLLQGSENHLAAFERQS